MQGRFDQQLDTALRNIQDAGPETRNLSGNHHYHREQQTRL